MNTEQTSKNIFMYRYIFYKILSGILQTFSHRQADVLNDVVFSPDINRLKTRADLKRIKQIYRLTDLTD